MKPASQGASFLNKMATTTTHTPQYAKNYKLLQVDTCSSIERDDEAAAAKTQHMKPPAKAHFTTMQVESDPQVKYN